MKRKPFDAKLPRRALGLVLDRAELHRKDKICRQIVSVPEGDKL